MSYEIVLSCSRRDNELPEPVKNVIVIDDEIANGGTIVELPQKLRERRVKRIAVARTHGLFTGHCVERLRAQTDVDEIVTTDTVPVPGAKRLT